MLKVIFLAVLLSIPATVPTYQSWWYNTPTKQCVPIVQGGSFADVLNYWLNATKDPNFVPPPVLVIAQSSRTDLWHPIIAACNKAK